MRDIYHQLVKSTPDFKNFTDEALAESSDLYSAGAFAINSALTLIGNLAFDATNAEDYSDEDARRDLILVSHALRHLPEWRKHSIRVVMLRIMCVPSVITRGSNHDQSLEI